MRTAVALMLLAPAAMAGMCTTAAAQSLDVVSWAHAHDPTWDDPQFAPPPRRELTRTQRRGLAWGAGAGFVSGLAVGAVHFARHECEGMGCLASPGLAMIAYLVLLPTVTGVAGAGVGLVVGTIVDDERPGRTYIGLKVQVGGP